jgi:hypothetical protein
MLLDYIHKIKEVTTALISIMTVKLEFIGDIVLFINIVYFS